MEIPHWSRLLAVTAAHGEEPTHNQVFRQDLWPMRDPLWSSSWRTLSHGEVPCWSSSWRTAACGKDPHWRSSWGSVHRQRDTTLQQGKSVRRKEQRRHLAIWNLHTLSDSVHFICNTQEFLGHIRGTTLLDDPPFFVSFTYSQKLNHSSVHTFFFLHCTSQSLIRHQLWKGHPGHTVSRIPSGNSKFTQSRWRGGNLLHIARNVWELWGM